MILASVVLAAKQPRLVQKFSGKGGKVADIVVAAQVIDGKIRLEMQHDHVVDAVALEGDLIAVNIIRARLIDGLHILVEHSRVQDIVVIQKGDIIARGQLQALVGVARDALVVLQHMVDDARILRGVFLTDLSHVRVLVIASVRQAQLPVLIGLVLHAVQKFRQELLRRIVERGQDAEFHHIGKDRLSLALRLLRRRKAGRAVALHILTLLHLASYLAHQPRNGPVAGQAIPGLLIEVKPFSQGRRQLPGEATLDPIQLKLELLYLFFTFLYLAYEDLGLLPLGLIQLFVILL